jgi:putative addiction module antidote
MDALKLKITRIGNSAGLVLPREALQRLNAAQGDTVFLTESPDGFRITSYDPDFERQTALLERVAKKRRNVLRKLAK